MTYAEELLGWNRYFTLLLSSGAAAIVFVQILKRW